jgi:hypothetical protein
MSALTAAINILPNNYDRLEDGPVRRQAGSAFADHRREAERRAHPAADDAPGSPGTVGVRGKRKCARSHSAHPARRRGAARGSPGHPRLRFGNGTADGGGRDGAHLETMRNKHAITLEHLRIGALKGVILDADGSVIYDLFDEFEITQGGRHCRRQRSTSKVRTLRYVEDNLRASS